MSKRVYVETYGCQMNVADTELILGRLASEGFERTEHPADADVMLVNTCAVRDNAEQRVIGRMGELKRYKRPGVVLGVVGCMAQRLGETMLAQAPHVDLVVGPDGYRGLPELIANAADGQRVADVEFKGWEHYEDVPAQRTEGQPSAFVTVQRGCDYRCTFCIVPMTRGRERSRMLQDVVRETEGLVVEGVTEVTLLGQTVNSYHDGTHDFADLLRAVGRVEGLRRLRFTSPYPNDFTDRAIAAMAEVDTVCEHVHLPVQSGSSALLKRMGRRYDRQQYLACVERLRAAIPDLALTTDIIVGFPGETDAEFRDTLDLMRTREPRSIPGCEGRATAPGRFACRIRCPSKTPPTGWSDSLRRCAGWPGTAISSWWDRRTRCSSSGARGGENTCRRARGPTRWYSWRGRRSGSGRTGGSGSWAHRAPPSRACLRHRCEGWPSWADPDGGRWGG